MSRRCGRVVRFRFEGLKGMARVVPRSDEPSQALKIINYGACGWRALCVLLGRGYERNVESCALASSSISRRDDSRMASR